MEKIVIQGYSDDLINIAGKIKGCDEYGLYEEKAHILCEPSGDIFIVEYNEDGLWKIEHDKQSGLLNVVYEQIGILSDDDAPYADRVAVSGEITRVRFSQFGFPMSLREKRSIVQAHLESDPDFSDELVEKLFVLFEEDL